ncbi:hypothetical protein RvY_17904 [Ramazzottius varieornatus]|uniref:VIT domain-containing protein n=1 Tax=Ramazzottius varieornatus TaxID=947166 RepID=A0A1D1W5R8_RAMVA|nr:hypothetical protein RvY_17904 [Ramazzottius varieornatus]
MESLTKRCCGLFIRDSNKAVPLTAVEYDVQVKSFASQITINQTYRNEETSDVECVYGFPINDQAAVVGFTVEIDGKSLVSQFKKKDEAFQEYTDALSRGDGAYLLDQSDRSDDTFILSVGRLPPSKECRVSIKYVATLESVTETVTQLTIPMSLSPRYNPHPNGSARSVAPPEVYHSSVPYSATLKAHITVNSTIKSVTSPSHPLSVSIQNPQAVGLSFGASQQPLDRDLIIMIEVQSNPEVHVEVEETSAGQYTAMCSFVPHFEPEECTVQSELIFLVDCSGSMQDQGKIDEARRAMHIFLRSIPQGCAFNFYRFGSSFESLFPQSQPYNADTFDKAKVYATTTQANLGGTEILEPLRKIYSEPVESGFARQLFVLTDGDVTNTDEVIQLVAHNASNTRVFAYGLGDSPSRSLVNGIAMAGNGKAEFIKKGEVLEEKIGRHLSRALQPAVTKTSVLWDGLRSVQQVPTTLPPVFNNDRLLVYAFFQKSEGITEPAVIFQIGKRIMEKRFSIEEARKAGFLEKLAARALIKDMETTASVRKFQGSVQNRGVTPSENEEEKKLQQRLTEVSLSYGVMSKYVSLVAVEKRSDSERAAAGSMKIREIPVQKTGLPQIMAPQFCLAAILPPMSRQWGRSRSRSRSSSRLGGLMYQKASGGASFEIAASGFMPGGVSSESLDFGAVTSLDQHDQGDARLGIQDAESVDTGTESALSVLLQLQQWDGSWSATDHLEKITGVRLADVRATLVRDAGEASAVDDNFIATAIAVEFIKKKFGGQKAIWQQIVNKGQGFLKKSVDNICLTAVANVVASLIT